MGGRQTGIFEFKVMGFLPIWPRWFVKFVAMVGTFHDTFLIVFAVYGTLSSKQKWYMCLLDRKILVNLGRLQGVMGPVTKWMFFGDL